MTAQRVFNDFNVVREPGLEPGRVTPPEPKPGHPDMKPLETRAIRGHAMPKTGIVRALLGPDWSRPGPIEGECEMSIITDFEAWQKHKELVVYGAMVAAQVMELRQREARAPELEDMERISEEAWAIANMERDHASELALQRMAGGDEG